MVEDALVNADVQAGQILVGLLDDEGMRPKAALWVYSNDHDRWRLWILPGINKEGDNPREIYSRIARVISKNRAKLQGIDIGDIEVLGPGNRAIAALSKLFHIEGISNVRLSSNRLNDIFLPDAIILRMAS